MKKGNYWLQNYIKHVYKRFPADSLDRQTLPTFLLQILLGRDALLEVINDYLDREEKQEKILSLVGFPGAGKSALMANSAKSSCSNPKLKVSSSWYSGNKL